ncbi:MAG: hypothetical protein ABSA18_10255 [Dehalococcoidia bacterium]|jgi:hypothetical protein
MKQHSSKKKNNEKKALSNTRGRHRNSGQMTVGWGRGASEYRPGLFTKRYLEERGEACTADVFYALKEDLKRINQARMEIGDKSIRGCTYNSFAKYWHWFKILGLVERADRDEPATYDFLENRVFYRLTAKGAAEEQAWHDPMRAAHPEF